MFTYPFELGLDHGVLWRRSGWREAVGEEAGQGAERGVERGVGLLARRLSDGLRLRTPGGARRRERSDGAGSRRRVEFSRSWRF